MFLCWTNLWPLEGPLCRKILDCHCMHRNILYMLHSKEIQVSQDKVCYSALQWGLRIELLGTWLLYPLNYHATPLIVQSRHQILSSGSQWHSDQYFMFDHSEAGVLLLNTCPDNTFFFFNYYSSLVSMRETTSQFKFKLSGNNFLQLSFRNKLY